MSEKKNIIVIYRFSGKQGFFSIPDKWCEECDLLINLVKNVLKSNNLENSTELIIKPWFLWFWLPLFRYGTFHAPILVVNNKVVSKGIVPNKEDVLKFLNR